MSGGALVASAKQRTRSAALWAQGGVDAIRLPRKLQGFPGSDDLHTARRDIEPAYREYADKVSSAGMAASLETTSLLLALCRGVKARSALDLGSGFSSYVLRFYAAESGATVASVDDNAEWLTKTEEFIVRMGLAPGQLALWPDIPNGDYDVVFHDLAGGSLREEAMTAAASRARVAVVFDDAQHSGHRRAMLATARTHHLSLFSVRPATLDSLSRYAMVGVR